MNTQPHQPSDASADADFELRLAELLGGEMDSATARRFRTDAAADPRRAARLAQAEAALAEFHAGLPHRSAASEATRDLPLPAPAPADADPRALFAAHFPADSAQSRPRRPASPAALRFAALARYAAVILIAFLSGYVARDPGGRLSPAGPGSGAAQAVALSPAERAAATSAIARNYAEVTRRTPNASTFGRALLALAQRR